MKKSIKTIAMFLLILVFFFVKSGKVSAANLLCSEIPVDSCPAPGIDYQGNACTKKYIGWQLECTKNTDAKTCSEIYTSTGTCKKTDDFGNTCDIKTAGETTTCEITKKAEYIPIETCADYYEYRNKGRCNNAKIGCIYIAWINESGFEQATCSPKANSSSTSSTTSETSISCEEIKKEVDCKKRSTDCRWAPLQDGVGLTAATDGGKCITLTPLSGACGDITDSNKCKSTDGCWYYSGDPDKNGKYCQPIKAELAGAQTCYEITSPVICGDRDDCTYQVAKCFPADFLQKQKNKNYSFSEYNFKCSDVKYLTQIWLIIRILAPFLILIFGSIDFVQAITADDEKKMKQLRGSFIIRLIAFILLIVLPFAIQFIFETMGTYGSENMCMVKCIATNDTSDTQCKKTD